MRLVAVLLICVISLSCESPMKEEKVESGMASFNLDLEEAERLSRLAFECIDQEYPNKLGQVLGDSSYLAPPSTLHPTFYGCFDWHSAVHGHWSLVRILKEYPNISGAGEIRKKISANLTPTNIAREVAYFDDVHNKNYERTYGWAWLLKLVEELDGWEDEEGQSWRQALRPLENLMVEKFEAFLPKLTYPIRVGEHPNTAFALSLAWDYAEKVKRDSLRLLIESRARAYYLDDKNCPIGWEPGGFDFLSPCLEEADIMSRVLPQKEFQKWMKGFLPSLESLEPAEVSDRSDGKLVHLDGLNLSRAWVLYRLAERLPEQESGIRNLADLHLAASLPEVSGGDYAGGHWLASFALYALASKDIHSP